jgi:class 3 adenylate cyclase
VPSLLVTGGPLAGRRVRIEQTAVLGRANADVTIEDSLISRRHAIVRRSADVLEIEDLGSLNGTWVNGERLTAPRQLRPGDVIRIGATLAEVESGSQATRGTVREPSQFADVRGLPFAPPGGGTPATAGLDDELRTVTALFADLVGSTELGERLGPHEVKAVVGEFVTRMSRTIERFGGSIQAYMGDGVCAYFGVPSVHEDDVERAARAGLALLDEVRAYAEEVDAAWGISTLAVRVGINTGETAVGLVGAAEPQAVSVGDTTNVAARLEAAAEPGTIAVGEATARALVHRFRLEPLGDVRVRGRTKPVAAWSLVGAVEAGLPGPPTPLVGRDAELVRLRAVIDDLDAGRGQVVLILGDAGIGKTRLLAELRTLVGDRATWLEGQCLSYGAERLCGPFIEVLRRWLEVGDRAADLAVRSQLRAKLGLIPPLDSAAAAPHLARLLGVRLEPEAEELVRRLTPEELGVELRRAYRAWLGGLAEGGPVVLALEDLHWADASTSELAAELLELTDFVPLLVVGTLRADPATEGWGLRVRVQEAFAHRAVELPLEPLGEESARALLEALPAGPKVEPAVIDEIVAEAEGNPLYLEELLNAAAEGLREPGRARWSPTVSIPNPLTPTLDSLLLARVDRLPTEARRLAQTAAVVGRRFPLRALEYLAGKDISEEVATLLRADVVREVRRFPEAEYAFRHGLLREAALSTLPPARRRELNGAVGAAFEALWGPAVDDQLEVLAHYFALSNDLAKGLRYLERAAERAARLDAGAQAAELWRRALLVAERLGDAEAQERLRVHLPTDVSS